MYVHIQKLRLDLQVQYHQGVLVLHQKAFISIFNGFVDNLALDVSTIDKINFVTAIASGDERLTQKAAD